jgi:hypothetical protein
MTAGRKIESQEIESRDQNYFYKTKTSSSDQKSPWGPRGGLFFQVFLLPNLT